MNVFVVLHEYQVNEWYVIGVYSSLDKANKSVEEEIKIYPTGRYSKFDFKINERYIDGDQD